MAATETQTDTSKWVQGNFGPVDVETTSRDLKVTGSLPEALNGLLLRDGPNPAAPVGANHHWFLGDGMIHSIELADGAAVGYRNRWVRTAEVEAARGLDAISRSDMGMGSGGVNVVSHAGRILALGEVGFAFELSPELDTLGQLDFDGRFAGNFTAHPKVDPVSGELFGFGYDFGPTFLRYFTIGADGSFGGSTDIDIPRSTMIHDMGLTETRAVLMDLPCVFDFDRLAEARFPFAWQPDAGARIGVMARAGGEQPVWVDIDPCYVFHVLNTYDDPAHGDTVVMDVIRYDSMFDTDEEGPDAFGTLHRWTIDPAAGSFNERQLDDHVAEFPRVVPTVEGRRHRYGYGTRIETDDSFEGGGLIKWDLETGESVLRSFDRGRVPGEPVLVARPRTSSGPDAGPDDAGSRDARSEDARSEDAGAEDDAWVLTVVYDPEKNRSEVEVADAADFAGDPVAVIELPVRIPYGFHGNWIPKTR